MSDSTVIYRQMETPDFPVVFDLLTIIFQDMELPLLKRLSLADIKRITCQAMADPTYRYSKNRCIVAVIDNQIVGVCASYDGAEEPIVDKPFTQALCDLGFDKSLKLFIDRETRPGEYYLDSIVVSSAARGHGVAKGLINATIARVKKEQGHRLDLNVDLHNPHAKAVYTSLGFKDNGHCVISGHQYDHMTRLF
ncbi:MAG: GNAT family N-acetyltransferase [Bavariicoccus seileri]|uniref:GNAT family N-acetyltransferase n=1 Tax=Bavariicoccus seileri TaxID=549685 RepID=UPI003F96EE38